MSITVEQIMRLPGMRGARVLAGREGLGRIVSTISVLEYSNPDDIQRRLYESIDFQGSELVISAFASVADNIDAQCDNIRYLAAAGEVGSYSTTSASSCPKSTSGSCAPPTSWASYSYVCRRTTRACATAR